MILEEIGQLEGYELVDSGEGMRLEKFGEYLLARPDPAVLWKKSLPESEWKKADAEFTRSVEDKGSWSIRGKMPEKWLMQYQPAAAQNKTNSEISFYAKLTPFKHTGVFPEQVSNWDFISKQLAAKGAGAKQIKLLNLFGYTGIPSILAAKLGAQVTHVDASKPSIGWAQENMLASGLPENSIRWILDDALKFVKREVRRGAVYDAIIMDPPAFGRGAKGEVWKFHEQFPELLHEAAQLVKPESFKFIIINAYAVSVSALLLKNMLEDFAGQAKLPASKNIDYGELVLEQNNKRKLSTGIFGRLYLK
jgi:23S rRNA (cytosine1962-C5)-methyltransferase